MAGGRPTDYSDEILTRTKEYVEGCSDWYDETIKSHRVRIPSVAGLAVYLGVARKTIYNWAEMHPEFLHILEGLLAEQEKRLIEGGLGGIYNPTIAKLVMAKHGYADEQNLNHEVGKTLADLMREADEPQKKPKAKVQK